LLQAAVRVEVVKGLARVELFMEAAVEAALVDTKI
jgi:hypothetical protein